MDLTTSDLRHVDIFAGLEDDQIEALIEVGQAKTYHHGETILRAGEQSTDVYLVLQGQVEVISELSEDTDSLVILGEGQTFGEMSLLDAGPRSATIRCISNTALILDFDRQALLAFWDQQCKVGYRMIFNLARDLAFKLRLRNLSCALGTEEGTL